MDREGVFNYETATSNKFCRGDYIKMILDAGSSAATTLDKKESLDTAGSSNSEGGHQSLSEERARRSQRKKGKAAVSNQI